MGGAEDPFRPGTAREAVEEDDAPLPEGAEEKIAEIAAGMTAFLRWPDSPEASERSLAAARKLARQGDRPGCGGQ